MFEASTAGILAERVDALISDIPRISPVRFNEENRYLPASVAVNPGFIDYSVTPYFREILECFDVHSPVREVNLKKGVQIGYTTLLESGLLYFMAHIRTQPIMFMTADKELAQARIENNIIPMLVQSEMADIIQSSDPTNARKTGKTKNQLQFKGGGVLYPFGANNADKMRTFSIAVMLKDELDAWPEMVGKDGDPDALSDARCNAYFDDRKIFRGSTPLVKGISKIEKQFKRGDQRVYRVLCRKCNAPQILRWEHIDRETGEVLGGFKWDYEFGDVFLPESVRYECKECKHPHYENDKEWLMAERNGAHWFPTSVSQIPNVRSYHLPAFYSKLTPWAQMVGQYLDAWDTRDRRVRDRDKYRTFYNNVLGEPFEEIGSRVTFRLVSGHRRMVYRRGAIPNEFAIKYSGSRVLMLTMSVDVHDDNLAVGVFGWTRDMRCYLVDYWRYRPKPGELRNCTQIDCSVWGKLAETIAHKEYTADDGTTYKIPMTVIDAGYAKSTVREFCKTYRSGVIPILGRSKPTQDQTLVEFAPIKSPDLSQGFRITVDYYKDRLSDVLKVPWTEQAERMQPVWHFNAPVDTLDSELKELTVETKREKVQETSGVVSHIWYRPAGADNELWDLLVYASAAVEIVAWKACIEYLELTEMDWTAYWNFLEFGVPNDKVPPPFFNLPD